MDRKEFNTFLGDCARDIGGQKFLDYILGEVNLEQLFDELGVGELDYSKGADVARKKAEEHFKEYQESIRQDS